MSDLDFKELARSFFNANKNEIYNKISKEKRQKRISTGSMIFDNATGGGIAPGCLYVTGPKESGKTSFILECMRNMFKEYPNSRGVFFPTERPITEELEERSGIKFVRDPKEWEEGTCLVVETIVYEIVFSFIYKLVLESDEDTPKYMFVIDSSNALIRREDLNKGFEEAAKVAGGALITSDFLRKSSLGISAHGHHLFITGQDRAEIRASQYAPGNRNKVGKSSGGNAQPHYSLWCFDFQKPSQDSYIVEGGNNVGRTVKVKFEKTPNETTGSVIEYPVQFKRKGNGSVWSDKEILDVFLGWEVFDKKGAWINLSEDFLEFMNEKGISLEPKYQGKEKLFAGLKEAGAIEECYNFFKQYT